MNEDSSKKENRAEEVAVLFHLISKCSVCNQNLQYVANTSELSVDPPKLVEMDSHTICKRLLHTIDDVRVLRERVELLRVLVETPSLRTRIREGVRKSLFTMARKL